jgi:hypothetical protein
VLAAWSFSVAGSELPRHAKSAIRFLPPACL